jgi:YVTN family beta-propeller protein
MRRATRAGSRVAVTAAIVAVIAVGGCSSSPSSSQATSTSTSTTRRDVTSSSGASDPSAGSGDNVYAHTLAGDLSPAVAGTPTRVYVPNSESNTVDVIDPTTFQVVDHFAVGRLPQHVTPSWDLKTLWVDNDEGNSLTPIDPRTGKPGSPVAVDDPYNLYFTPDGSKAIVVAERLHRLDFRDPHTWKLEKSIPIAHDGVDHADFSADGQTMIVSCEFSGWLVRVDLRTLAVTGELHVGGTPVDVKLSPDGSVFYVANMARGGVSVVDASTFTERTFVPTGAGAHGLYLSRDTKSLYVSNRMAGSVSVLDSATGALRTTWQTGGSPDMGGVTADGTQLWLSGRYNREVYVIDTSTGAVLHRIQVGSGPHGLSVFPQPGRYSLGHTGVFR